MRLHPGDIVFSDSNSGRIAIIYSDKGTKVDEIRFDKKRGAYFELETGDLIPGDQVVYSQKAPESWEKRSAIYMPPGVGFEPFGGQLLEVGSAIKVPGIDEARFIKRIYPSDPQTMDYYIEQYGLPLETYPEDVSLDSAKHGWYDIMDFQGTIFPGGIIELWPGPYVSAGDAVLAHWKGKMIIAKVITFYYRGTEDDEIYLSSIPWDFGVREYYFVGITADEIAEDADVIPATEIYMLPKDFDSRPPPPMFKPPVKPPTPPVPPVASFPVPRRDIPVPKPTPRVPTPTPPVRIRPREIAIPVPPSGPPEPQLPPPEPPTPWVRRKREVKKKKELLVANPKSVTDPDVSPTDIITPGDFIVYDDKEKKEGYVYKIWWYDKEIENAKVDALKMENVAFYIEVSSQPLVPDEPTKMIPATSVLEFENLSAEMKSSWQDVEEFGGPQYQLMVGDLTYVPQSILPQVVEQITDPTQKQVNQISRTAFNINHSTVFAGGQTVKLSDLDFISGPYLSSGDIIIWFREANLLETIMDKAPVEAAVILSMQFAENPNVIITRSPWEFKDQYNYLIRLADGQERLIPGSEVHETKEVFEFGVILEKEWIQPGDVIEYKTPTEGEKVYEQARVTEVYKVYKIYTDSWTVPDSSMFEPVNMVHVKDIPTSAFDVVTEVEKKPVTPGVEDELEEVVRKERVMGLNVIRKVVPPRPDGAPAIGPRGIPRPPPTPTPKEPEFRSFIRDRDYGEGIPPIPPIPPMPTSMSPEELTEMKKRVWRRIQAAATPPMPPPPPPSPEFNDIKLVEKKGEKK